MELGLYPSIHQIKGWNTTWPPDWPLTTWVSIHQSIKSRVETNLPPSAKHATPRSLSINPSNQGLKLLCKIVCPFGCICLYPSIHQIKGWNIMRSLEPFWRHFRLYPSIHQIKGWNNHIPSVLPPHSAVSIHQSIKSRVETWTFCISYAIQFSLYPSIHQIKGWNLFIVPHSRYHSHVSIHQSIKSRVETLFQLAQACWSCGLYPSIHQIKGWNRSTAIRRPMIWRSLSINPSNQGLKLTSVSLMR